MKSIGIYNETRPNVSEIRNTNYLKFTAKEPIIR